MRYPTSIGIAIFLVFTATLLFWLCSFGIPYIDSIYYLRADTWLAYWGNYGQCVGPSPGKWCERVVGYSARPYIPGGDNLTGSFVLVSVTAAFGTIAFLMLIAGIRSSASGLCAIFTTLFTSFLSTITLILVLSAFVTAHRRLGRDGIERHYGPAFAMVIVAWLMYLAAIPFVIIGWFAIRRARKEGVPETTTTTTEKKRRFW